MKINIIYVFKTFKPSIKDSFYNISKIFDIVWMRLRKSPLIKLEKKLQKYLSIYHLIDKSFRLEPIQITQNVIRGEGSFVIKNIFNNSSYGIHAIVKTEIAQFYEE